MSKEMIEFSVEEVIDTTIVLPLENPVIFYSKIIEFYSRVPQEVRDCTIDELVKKGNVGSSIEELRIRMNKEVNSAFSTGRKVNLNTVVDGICSLPFFYSHVAGNPYRLEYISRKSSEYEARANAILNMAMHRYEDLLSMNIKVKKKGIVSIEPDGSPVYGVIETTDPKLAEVLLGTIKNIEDRVKGKALQSQMVQHIGNEKSEKEYKNIEDIQKRLDEIGARIGTISTKKVELIEEVEYEEVEEDT